MPIYEYQCDECGEKFELFVRSTSTQEEIVCAKCGSTKVHKAISLFGVGANPSGGLSATSCGPGPV
ncbi:MAG: zinc ribbon domain-containing protein [Chloroflexi bacterium]|nr:zinc ribbon domain-containing protein [Chloroflexota bacterium]